MYDLPYNTRVHAGFQDKPGAVKTVKKSIKKY